MIKSIIRELRVYQWTKNVLVFAPLIFAQKADSPDMFLNAILAFIAFCMAASATYVFNDIMDVEQDKKHPKKSGNQNYSLGTRLVLAWHSLGTRLEKCLFPRNV